MANAHPSQDRSVHPSVGIPVKPLFLGTGVSCRPVKLTGAITPTSASKRALLTG